uniref:EamA domain-containing protein n=1 Tax=Tetradesmus obliquus TaxID=3088 RepID=A0A383VYR8_TETOB|eukprot:jgi/Sobl393_1/19742/SZX70019.1
MATASNSFNSPFQASFQRVAETAATYGFALVDEVHSLVDEPTYVPKQIHPRVKQLAVTGLIFFGTLISTLGKLAYEVEAVGRDGTTRPFGKPWFLVLLMFAGMSLNLPLSLFLDLARSLRRRSKYLARLIARSSSTRRRLTYEPYQPLYTPLLQFDADDDEVYQAPRVLQSPFASSSTAAAAATLRFRLLDKQLLLLAVPTLFDLAGAALLNVGLLAVTASATQMLRQSLLPFAALMGVCLWGKRMNRYHLTGLAGCMTGLCMVAAAALASGFGGSSAPSSRGAMAAGIGLILASQMLAAGQLLIDQGWYYSRLQLSPLKVVGAEGLLGFVLTLCVVLPLAQVSAAPEGWGLAEDSWDSLVMVGSRPLLQLLLLAYTGSLAAYNICGMVTTGELSAVDTALLQAVRTLFVWIINLLIFAVASAFVPDASDQLQPLLPGNHTSSTTAAAAAAAAGAPAAGLSAGSSLLHFPSGSGSSSRSGIGLLHQQQQQQRQGFHALWQSLWQQQQQQQHGIGLGSSSSLQETAAAGLLGLGAAFNPGPAQLVDVASQLPGEPWLPWSFLQAAGFLVLVLAAVTYSKGDNERQRRQLQDEAALIMMDRPPSVAGSFASGAHAAAGRRFTAHMDIDAAAYLRSLARGSFRDQRERLYGITPVPSQSQMTPVTPRSGSLLGAWSMGRQRSGGLAGGGGGCLGFAGTAEGLDGWESLAGMSPGSTGSPSRVGSLGQETVAAAAAAAAAGAAAAACDTVLVVAEESGVDAGVLSEYRAAAAAAVDGVAGTLREQQSA